MKKTEGKMRRRKKSTFFADFKKFISKGNIVDLAIAVIIGGAFGKIITSLVNNIIMPPLSLALGGGDITDLKWVLRPAIYDVVDGIAVLVKNETAIGYGFFIQAIIEFLIIAFCIFLIFRLVTNARNNLKKIHKKSDAAADIAVEPPKLTQEELLAEIRDLLRESKEKDRHE
jgi:large conductance mechanosensitive channel